MKKIILLIFISCGFLSACKCVKNTANTNTEMTPSASKLSGTWELNYISGKRIAFDGLYPDKKPQINFNLTESELGGNTSCNGFGSKMVIDGNKITISEPFAKTMIFCEGEGESSFLDMLKKVNSYSVNNDNTLTFSMGDIAVMRFVKK
jgi:heat shock protein HslJ